MSYKKSDNRKNVVIVGGGGAGQFLARTLSQKLNPQTHNLILIDSRPFRIFLPAALRLVTSDIDNLQETALIPYEKVFYNDNGTFIKGKVVSIHKGAEKGGSVSLENGESIEFEYLVLASGALWEGPVNFPEKKEDFFSFIEHIRRQVKDAKDIVLIGGGSVGVEFAGEIKDIYPQKNVTIVQGGDHLFSDVYPLRFRTAVEKSLGKRGINVVFNEFIDDIPTGKFSSVKTRSGKTIKADAVFQTRGTRPNTEFIKSLGSDVLTQRGLVKVKPTLQLPSYNDIYAAGDILDIKEEKQLAKANNHVAIVAANILATIASQPLKPYKGSSELILVTIGKNGGVAYLGILWGIVLGDWFARMLKSKTLMIPQARSALGY